ncbi:hypothetical protein NBRC103581_02390 [Gluconobacter wancherniae NBRC 103581]|nr:hypothetical protein NBRC103581_02390 [Gluconobacter wancherniae NBRC 103581]
MNLSHVSACERQILGRMKQAARIVMAGYSLPNGQSERLMRRGAIK